MSQQFLLQQNSYINYLFKNNIRFITIIIII